MSNKIKSSIFLGSFILVFSFYSNTLTDVDFAEGNTTQISSVNHEAPLYSLQDINAE